MVSVAWGSLLPVHPGDKEVSDLLHDFPSMHSHTLTEQHNTHHIKQPIAHCLINKHMAAHLILCPSIPGGAAQHPPAKSTSKKDNEHGTKYSISQM